MKMRRGSNVHLHDALALQGLALEQGRNLLIGVIVAIAQLAICAKAPQPGAAICPNRSTHLGPCTSCLLKEPADTPLA